MSPDHGMPEMHTTSSFDAEVLQMDVQEVLSALCLECATRRIRLESFMTDGDNLNTGEISAARFRSALGRSSLMVTELQVKSVFA